MKSIQITREQAHEQLKADIQKEKDFANRFYSVRVSQLKDILANGHGIFSLFENEKIEVTIK